MSTADFLRIVYTGHEIDGTGKLTFTGYIPEGVPREFQVACRFVMKPYGQDPRINLWSAELSRFRGRIPEGDATFILYGIDESVVVAEGHCYPRSGFPVDRETEIPSLYQLICRSVHFPRPATVNDDAIAQFDWRQWVIPLYNVDFIGSPRRDEEGKPLIFDGTPWATTVEWRGWKLEFVREHDRDKYASGDVPLTGYLSILTSPEVDHSTVRSAVDELFELISPVSGVTQVPTLVLDASHYDMYWTPLQRPVVQRRAHFQFLDRRVNNFEPYLDAILPFYESLPSGPQRQALRALARSLVVPPVPIESAIMAISSGFEILREHFWPGERYLFSEKSGSQLRAKLKEFGTTLPTEHQAEFIRLVPGKAREVRRRPLAAVLPEIGRHFLGTKCGTPPSLAQLVAYRNELVHGGFMEVSLEAYAVVDKTSGMLNDAFTGLIGLLPWTRPEVRGLTRPPAQPESD